MPDWRRLQRALAWALVPLSLGALVLHAVLTPEVPFVASERDAPWWMAPMPVSALLEQWGDEGTPVTRFEQSLVLPAVPAQAALELRALRSFVLRVNGEVPPDGRSQGDDWRRWRRVEIAGLLRVGENRVEVDVGNRRGPGLLALRSEGIALEGRWQASLEGVALGPAIPADDTRRNPHALTVETPFEALVEQRNGLLALFVAGVALAGLLHRHAPAGLFAALPGLALALASLAWVWLYVAKVASIPTLVGFDARAHLAYLDFLREHGTLPLATDGWSMYHPPLFYVPAAILQGISDAAAKVLPWIAGLGIVFLTHGLAQRLHSEPKVAWLAVVFAAVLPVNLYSAAYLSNETLHALLAGLALLATVDALLAPASSARQLLAVGAWLGLAALTKFTVLALVPVALFFLGVKLLAVEGASPGRALSRALLPGVAFLAVAGWFYARNVFHFGTPVVGNWALPGADQVWWQQPGFHTAAYWTGFGEALRHPYLSGFASFWDGVYSTFWGDGFIAGRVFPSERHGAWSYPYMSAGYLLALPLTALLALGIVRALRTALGDASAHRRAAFSFLLTASYAVGFAFLSLTVSLPFFAQAKAPYALCLVPVLAVFFAAGSAWVDDALAAPGRVPLRLAFAGLLTTCLGCLFLGFAA